jgi:two-component system CheB/CheR fusion protein
VPIVALGASAGGLPAIQSFFDALPADTGLAYVVLMHLPSDHESNLASILRPRTDRPVQTIEDGTAPEADTIHVLPPQRTLGIEDGQLRLHDAAATDGVPPVIDSFFRALAAEQGTAAVGVILSGAGTDGTQGMRALDEAGALTMVQAPDDAPHDSMPQSALATNVVDVVAPVRELAVRLAQIRAQPEAPPSETKFDASTAHDKALRKILEQVYVQTGHDFTNYKRSTLRRRIGRRLTVTRTDALADYLNRLRRDPDEVDALFKQCLICVTQFFRDRAAFDALAETVLPELFEQTAPGEQVRVWSAGCATGEEAYSLAMLLQEQADELDRAPDFQVFATDASGDAIDTARQGRYPESVVADLSAERRDRFFVADGSHFRIRKSLRERVIFSEHNLLEDPPFPKIDLASCRNVLIYLNREMQQHVISVLHYALRPEGVLFLGASESTAVAGDRFAPLNAAHSLFRRTPGPKDEEIPLFPRQKRLSGRDEVETGDAPQPPEGLDALHRQLLVSDVASLLVDPNYNIVHLTDPAARYLERPGGPPTHNVLETVPAAMRAELRDALATVFRENAATERRGLQTWVDDAPTWITLRVRPVGAGQNLAQILFTEAAAPQPASDEEVTAQYVAQLESALRRTKAQLQKTAEEYETTTEELEASNEELRSMNEELQSKNQKIETSKEELQSINRELRSLNEELQRREQSLRVLSKAVEQARDAVLITEAEPLDRPGPRVVYVNEAFESMTGYTEEEILGETPRILQGPATDPAVIRSLRAALEAGTSWSGETINYRKSGEPFVIHWSVAPVRGRDGTIEHWVSIQRDMTEQRRAERRLREARNDAERQRDMLQRTQQVAQVGGWEFDPRSDTLHGTREFHRITGLPEDDDVDLETGLALCPPDDRPRIRAAVEQSIEDGTPFDLETTLESVDGPRREVRVQGTAEQKAGRTLRLTGILQDITERKRAWRQVREERNFVSAVLDTIGALVVVLDPEGQIVRFNEECQAVTGYTAEDVKGENLVDLLVPPAEQTEVRSILEALRCGTVAQSQHENHWRTRDGEDRLIRWSNTVLRSEDGRIEHLIGTGIDVTRRRQLEREVISASDEERRRIGQDLHDMLASHLAGTAMMADSLAGQREDGRSVSAASLRKVARLIEDAGEQARTLSHSLMPLEVKDDELAVGLRKLADRQEAMRDLSCSFELGDAVPSLTGETASHLYRIASEAVSNAVKHADPDVVTIRLVVEADRLVLTVQDDGIGIPEDTVGAEGLGLHIMQYRADLIGARLTIEPGPEHGTLVQCRLPLQEASPPASRTGANPDRAS